MGQACRRCRYKNYSANPQSQRVFQSGHTNDMQIAKSARSLSLLPASLALGLSLAVQAQDDSQPVEDQEAIQPIELERPGDNPVGPQEEEFLDMVFDEQTQSYRLVEDDEEDDWVEPPSERETQIEELKRLFVLYSEALENRDFLEADTLAKRVVEMSIRVNGLDSHDSAKAITNLGIAQHGLGQYDAALRNFLASIEIVERIDDNLSPALINPLRGLAATQASIGRPDLSRLTYQRAVHVSHVNEGPHNKDQIEILESMAELHISQGDYDEASDVQQHIYSIQSRKIDPDSMDMIPALEKKAEWQHRLQQYHRERVTWRQIIDIIEDTEGKESMALIKPLTNLGKSYLFVSPVEFEYQPQVSASSGEGYLRRALSISEKHPEATWRMTEDAMLSLGDYYILSGRPNRAEKVYQETWEFLTEGGEREQLDARREHLENVKMLQRVFPPKYYNSQREDVATENPPDSFVTGTMSFDFTVSALGRVVDVRVIETQRLVFGELAWVGARSLRRLIYRPRLVEMDMTATPNIIYTHEFYYRPNDIPQSRPDPVNADESANEEAPAAEGSESL